VSGLVVRPAQGLVLFRGRPARGVRLRGGKVVRLPTKDRPRPAALDPQTPPNSSAAPFQNEARRRAFCAAAERRRAPLLASAPPPDPPPPPRGRLFVRAEPDGEGGAAPVVYERGADGEHRSRRFALTAAGRLVRRDGPPARATEGALVAALEALAGRLAEQPAPVVNVHPPAVTVEAAPAPNVHVTVEAPPRPGAIRATKAEDGTTTFEVFDGVEEAAS